MYNVHCTYKTITTKVAKTTCRYRTDANNIDWSKFQRAFPDSIETKLYLLDDLASINKIDRAVDAVEKYIIAAYDANLPRYFSVPVRKAPWIDQN